MPTSSTVRLCFIFHNCQTQALVVHLHRVPISCFVDDSSHYIAFVRLESLPVGELSTAPKSLSQLKVGGVSSAMHVDDI